MSTFRGPLQTARGLRGPNDPVRVVAHEYPYYDGSTIKVEYVGPSLPALVDAGCITQVMIDQFTAGKKPGKGRLDEHGNRYRRRGARCKAQPERVIVTRYITERDFALSLPGVRENLIDETDESDRDDSGRVVRQPRNKAERPRAVGRRQRLAQWTTIENVIWPNWQYIHGMRAAPLQP